uniref:angiopoietin-related protein 3-like n=1 Tax=Semicossyphus pulcher TaxID=241346 RepID=UPI0037E950ED
MRMSRVLQLSVLLLGLCQAHSAPSTSTSQEAGAVPIAQLKMLSLGLTHLLQGVKDNAKWLEEQGQQVEAELDGATEGLESLQKQHLQAGRTRRQVRKDLQILRARGDRLWRTVKDLQKGLEDLETEQGATQQRMNGILQRVESLSEPRSGGQTGLDIASVKVIMDKQAQRLASLTSVVSVQDRMIDRRQQHIEHLEKQVSKRLPAALRADSDSDRV